MRLIDLEQNTPEWKEFRRMRIGASDAAAIMGLNPYETPYRWWEVNIFNKEREVTPAMQRGKDLEPIALKKFNHNEGVLHDPEWKPTVGLHDDFDWMMASFDGWNGKTHVEIKCLSEALHNQALNGKIPDLYYPQLQHQMVVSGAEFCYYFSYDGQDGVILTCQRDDEFCNSLIALEKEMYDRLINFDPPEHSNRDYICKDHDVLWTQAAKKCEELKKQMDELKKEYEKWREDLISLCHKNSCEGNGIKVTRYFSQGRVDYKSIPELKDIPLDNYRKSPIESWRLSF